MIEYSTPGFIMLGCPINKDNSVNIFEVMANISPNEVFVLELLYSNIELDWTEVNLGNTTKPKPNIEIVINRRRMSAKYKRRLDIAIPKLIASKLLKKVGTNKYIINPNLLVNPYYYNEQLTIWNSIN